jgi:RNA polymerase sigma factor (TIGR02999 family)
MDWIPVGRETPRRPEGSSHPEKKTSPSVSAEQEGADAVIQEIYQELRRLAHSFMRQQRPNHTLQATALVHEAYLRMHRRSAVQCTDRSHFFAVAARAMRQILVDHERGRRAQKRGAGALKLNLDEAASITVNPQPDLLDLNGALDKLAAIHPRKAQVVELLYFGGLKAAEAAEVLGVASRTVERDWHFARVWLHREISDDADGQGSSVRPSR